MGSGRPGSREAFPLRRWVGHVVVGEGLGFLLPASGFALGAALGLAPWPQYALQLVLGFGEGALLGLAQALALRGTRGQVPRARWTWVTGLAAALAWALGMAPTTLLDLGVTLDPRRPLTLLALAAGGLALLLTIPTAQWTVLRRVVERAWRWIPLNVAAWLAGIAFTLAPSPIVTQETAPALVGALFAAGGVLMALTVAVITGLGLRRMVGPGAGG